MEDHSSESKPSRQGFRVFHQSLPDALTLQVGKDGHLLHPNVAASTWHEHKAPDQRIATVAGDVAGFSFRRQLLRRETKSEGLAED